MLNAVYLVYMIPLSLGAVFSLKSFRLKWPGPYRRFSVFLCSTLGMESFALCWKFFLYRLGGSNPSNTWIYNIYLIPEYMFYYFFFNSYLNKGWAKKICRLLVIFFTTFSIVNIGWIQELHNLDTYTIITGNLLVIFLSLAYFIQTLHEKNFKKQSSDPLFWITTGSFIFFTGSLPYFIFMNYLVTHNIPLALALFNILLILNTFMYTFYLIAFLCKPVFQK